MNFQQGSLTQILKDGVKHLSDKDKVVVQNIDAVRKLADVIRTSMGPSGLNKLVVNHLGKLFISHDAATIMQELEVIHPAAKVVVLASQAIEKECGDGTNFVITLTAELLTQAQQLLIMGLHTSDIINGYIRARDFTLKIMEEQKDLIADVINDMKDQKRIQRAMYAPISSKEFEHVDVLSPLISKACLIACPKDSSKFAVDNIRVAKITGGGTIDSHVVPGFVVQKKVRGTVKHVKNAKIACFGVSFESANTEGKGTWVIKDAVTLLRGRKNEETLMRDEIEKLKLAGVNVVVVKGKFCDLSLHYIEENGLLALTCPSKFDMIRLCRAVGAVQLTRIGTPSPEEMGHCTQVDQVEIGGKKCVVFRQNLEEDTKIATIVLRGATRNILEEMEKAVDDGVNVFKTLTKDNRLVAGGGAFEMEIAKRLTSFGEDAKGLDQYAIRKYAESFLVIPKTLAECSGHRATDVVTTLRVKHQEGGKFFGVHLFEKEGHDVVEAGILDCFATKHWGIRLATQSAIDLLSIDQLIMSRPSGGPKPRSMEGKDWDTDDNQGGGGGM